MSKAPVAPAEQVSIETPYLRFPPFPEVPEGVQIIPFKDFKERGIQMFSGENGVEVDGLGIPTVELRVKHDTDGCKTDTKRVGKKKAAAAQNSAEPKRRLEWWEQWAEGEDLRVTSFNYNPNASRIDRLYQAANDFKTNRTWPPNVTGVRGLWDQYRLFVGLVVNTPIWHKADKIPQEPSPEEDEYLSDEVPDETELKTNITVESGNPEQQQWHPRRRPRPPYANYGQEPPVVETDEEIQALLNGARSEKEEQMTEFLNDPEKSTKVFLSSYMRSQGLIWSDRNLVNVPQLVGFFISFLLRNRVLPEHERELRRALEVVSVAKKELPLTSKIGKALPDDFSKACEECWGRMSSGFDSVASEDVQGMLVSEEERDAKRQKLDHDKDMSTSAATVIPDLDPVVADFEAELKAANVQVIPANDVDLIKEIVDDNIGSDVDMDTGGWGSGASTWGQDVPLWGAPADSEIDVSGWNPPSISLTSLLGPTALPITHTTGVVEWSLRRIKSVTPPPASQTRAPSGVEGEVDPEAVEGELETRFAKMVLEPWLGWDKTGEAEICQPKILNKSKGPAIGSDGQLSGGLSTTGGKVHDVRSDEVTVLVPTSAINILGVGMGLAATWVQIVRQEPSETKEPAKKKKRKKGKKTTSYWYMEQLMLIIPSYHTA